MMDLSCAPGSRVYIAAHRGVCGGNIPCNTLLAYELALRDGADLIELDVTRSRDGVLFCFHPGLEPVLYADPTPIGRQDAAAVSARLLRNPDLAEADYTAPTLDEALELLKNRCVVAIDKYWDNMGLITEAVLRHGMERQVLLKLRNDPVQFRMAAALSRGLPVLPVIHREDTVTDHLEGLNCVGVEAIFREETDPIASDAYVEKMHRQGKLLWCNAIIYDRDSILTAGHSDDRSLLEGPDAGWGYLCRKKFDIIQTDWTRLLRQYLDERRPAL